MKRTLLSAMLCLSLASSASALSLSDAVYSDTNITSSTASSVTLSDLWPNNGGSKDDSFTVTITLNMKDLSTLIGSGAPNIEANTNVTIPTLLSVSGNLTIGTALGTGYYSTTYRNGILGTLTKASTGGTTYTAASATNYSYSGNPASSPHVTDLSSVDISAYSAAAITLSHTDTSRTDVYLTLMDASGIYTTYYGGSTQMKAGSGIGDLQTLNFNADLVSSAYLMAGTAGSNTAAEALNKAALTIKAIPEPATATLSLLALAGLAARRRRK